MCFPIKRKPKRYLIVSNFTNDHVCIVLKKYNGILPAQMTQRIKLSHKDKYIHIQTLDGHEYTEMNVKHFKKGEHHIEINKTWSWENGYDPKLIIN